MSTENRLARAYGLGCARGMLIYIVVTIVVIAGFACLAFAAAFLPIDSDYKIFVWVGLILLFMFIVIGGIVAWGVWAYSKRARELDEAFVPLGLQGRIYLTNGRQFHGSHRGYPMHVYFYRGPTLQIYFDVPLQTRVGIGRTGAIARFAADRLDRDALDIDDPEFEHLVVYPDDQKWAAELFADSQAREAVLRLTKEESAVELRTLSITPNALLLQSRHLHTDYITPEVVRQWVNDLYELARIAQDIYPPEVTTVESKMESASRADRGKFTWPVIGITCGFFAVMTVCILAITAALIFIEESGF